MLHQTSSCSCTPMIEYFPFLSFCFQMVSGKVLVQLGIGLVSDEKFAHNQVLDACLDGSGFGSEELDLGHHFCHQLLVMQGSAFLHDTNHRSIQHAVSGNFDRADVAAARGTTLTRAGMCVRTVSEGENFVHRRMEWQHDDC